MSFAGRQGIEYVYVAQRKGTQYQKLSRERFAEELARHFADSRYYMYGTSLGAYCAAYYSRNVGASFLALAPRLPAYPGTSRLMPVKFKNEGYFHEPIYEGGSPGRVSANRHVLFDERNVTDSVFARTSLAMAYPEAVYHHVEAAGHYVPRALQLSGQLKRVAGDFLNDRKITYELDVAAILDWHEERFQAQLAKGRLGYALEHYTVLIQQRPSERMDSLTRSYDEVVKRSSSRPLDSVSS